MITLRSKNGLPVRLEPVKAATVGASENLETHEEVKGCPVLASSQFLTGARSKEFQDRCKKRDASSLLQ
jgi:hypothetical protein